MKLPEEPKPSSDLAITVDAILALVVEMVSKAILKFVKPGIPDFPAENALLELLSDRTRATIDAIQTQHQPTTFPHQFQIPPDQNKTRFKPRLKGPHKKGPYFAGD